MKRLLHILLHYEVHPKVSWEATHFAPELGFSVRFHEGWNSIPVSVAITLECWRHQLRAHIMCIDNAYYTNHCWKAAEEKA